jgi:hypothetical protein
MNIAGGHAGEQDRRAADEDGVDIDSIFIKKAMVLSGPQRRGARVHRRKSNDNLCRRGCRLISAPSAQSSIRVKTIFSMAAPAKS